MCKRTNLCDLSCFLLLVGSSLLVGFHESDLGFLLCVCLVRVTNGNL